VSSREQKSIIAMTANAMVGDRDTALADPLGSFPGIDVSAWRNSRMGDADLYWRLLGMFLDEQNNFPAPFDAALAAADLATMRLLAHNLKSLAGTLGAHGVERAAMVLEGACAAEEQATQLQSMLNDVALHLHPVLNGLRSWQATRQPVAS